MAKITVKFPIENSMLSDIFDKTTTTLELVKSQLYVLLMTDRRTRVMLPNFGVDLHRIIFETVLENRSAILKSQIIDQAKLYVPNANILDVTINTDEEKLIVEVKFSLREDATQVESLVLEIT